MSQPEPQDAQGHAKCFLSLPHSFDMVRGHLKKAVENIAGESLFVIVSEGDTLRNEISFAIDSSSILIADLSSSPNARDPRGPRPSIMWEIGYAYAAGMPFIGICQQRDQKYIPSLLSDFHIIYYDVQAVLKMQHAVEIALKSTIHRSNRAASRVFRSACHFNRSSLSLDSRFLGAKKLIRILQLNLDTVKSQVPILVQALGDNPTLSVQILTLNPFSRFAEDRASQLGTLPRDYRHGLVEGIQTTHATLKAATRIPVDRWALNIFDTFPTQIMYQIDDALIHSAISHGTQSRTMLHFEVRRGQPNASETFEAHFNQLWSRSQEYTKWYQENQDTVRTLLSQSLPVSAPARNAERNGRKAKSKKR